MTTREHRDYARRALDLAWDDTDRDPRQAWRVDMWDRLVQWYDGMIREEEAL